MRTKKERARYIEQKLDTLYPSLPIPLYHTDAYTLLIAVLLSAQCTDKRVNLVTPALFKLAKTPKQMSALSVETIRRTIQSCGLANTKAKNIKRLSEILFHQYNQRVPRSFEELESLPGVGHKTASVVMIHAFKIPAFPVDTHIHRLAQRWKLSSGKNVLQTEKDLKKLWPPEQWEKLHLQLIAYGRAYCTARGCDGTKCPICKALFPNRKKPVILRKTSASKKTVRK